MDLQVIDNLTGQLLRIVYVRVRDAALWDSNPKEHDIGGIITSIQKHGFRDAPVYDGKLGAIAAGNGRAIALNMMEGSGDYDVPPGIGLDSDGAWCMPIQFGIDATSREAAEAFGLDHNNLTMMGGPVTTIDVAKMYDPEQLADLTTKLRELGQLPITVDDDDVDVILSWAKGDLPIGDRLRNKMTPDEVPDILGDGVLGPYDVPGVYCVAAQDGLSELPNGCIDLTVTSPPYDKLREYEGFTFPFEEIARQMVRVTKEGGVIVWVVRDQTVDGSETGTSFEQALLFKNALGMNLWDTMIFETQSPPLTHRRYEQAFEFMFVFSKGEPNVFNPIMVQKKKRADSTKARSIRREPDGSYDYGYSSHRATTIKRNIWYYPTAHYATDDFAHDHPAIFPEPLAADHIGSWTHPGMMVLDPLCGSGTTLKVAEKLGRVWIGFDLSEEYVKIVKARIATVRE